MRAWPSTGRGGHKPANSENTPTTATSCVAGAGSGPWWLRQPRRTPPTSSAVRQLCLQRNRLRLGEGPGASPDEHGVPGVAAIVLRGLLQRLEVEVLQGREHTSAPCGRAPGAPRAPHSPPTPPLTRLPHTSSSISSGRNRYLRGDSLVTMWKPLRKALNCFSTDLLRM